MQVNYQFRTDAVSADFRRHADSRLQALSKFFDRINDVKVVVSQQRNWQIVEITVDADGALIRGEEHSAELLSSFDRALDRVERQLRRYQDRLQSKSRQTPRKMAAREAAMVEEPPALPDEPPEEIRIVKTKSHALKPMSPEEAALQMELLGHSFFMFFNSESEQINVVYRRHDDDYGLIEPEIGT